MDLEVEVLFGVLLLRKGSAVALVGERKVGL
jgi:hypothetical protein